VTEAKLAGDVFVAIFECEDGSFVDFDGVVLAELVGCVIDVGFFAWK
jgi:hypothetical protein